MSTNKKFRIQNGADIVGELSINDVTVIDADGKIVAGAIADAVADLTASDIADLQSQVTAILGTSPETLDTLQEIVNAFQDADTNLVASVASNSSDIATINYECLIERSKINLTVVRCREQIKFKVISFSVNI